MSAPPWRVYSTQRNTVSIADATTYGSPGTNGASSANWNSRPFRERRTQSRTVPHLLSCWRMPIHSIDPICARTTDGHAELSIPAIMTASRSPCTTSENRWREPKGILLAAPGRSQRDLYTNCFRLGPPWKPRIDLPGNPGPPAATENAMTGHDAVAERAAEDDGWGKNATPQHGSP